MERHVQYLSIVHVSRPLDKKHEYAVKEKGKATTITKKRNYGKMEFRK